MPGPRAGEVGAFLLASPVFARLPAKEIEALAAVAREEAHRVREYVFLEGDPALWLCLVRTGRVRIVRHSRTGKDVVLELLGPGEVFGGVAVIERRPYPAAAQATEPSVVVKIPAEIVAALVERYPSVIREMALMMGRRLRAAHDSVKSLAVEPVEARLAATAAGRAGRRAGPAGSGAAVPAHPAEPGGHGGHHGRDDDSHREPVAQGRAPPGRRPPPRPPERGEPS